MSNFLVTSSPHFNSGENTRSIMLDVVFALLPALVLSGYLFGFRSLTLIAISVASCVAFEYLYRRLMKKTQTVSDLSAVVTGIMLAFNLPVGVPLWIPIVGSFFAIIIVKQLFGGIGCNFVNPALAARVFLFSWPTMMTTWAKPVLSVTEWINVDSVTGATPLASLKKGALPTETILDLLFGFRGGCLGETSALLLIAGGLYLLSRRVIHWQIPTAYLATVALLTFLFPQGNIGRMDFMLYELLSGGLIFGAFFMATDYTTSPMTRKGGLVFGIGCGLLTVFIRTFGAYPEGVSFSILVMNLLVPFIDKATRPRKFGTKGGMSLG